MKTCTNCKRGITKEMESPDERVCGECFAYLQDIRKHEARQTVTREMAHDAGMPEIEGWEI